MACFDINEIKKHLCCQIEMDEYDDGHVTIECKTCNKILLRIYPLILPNQLNNEVKQNVRKNYHVRGS